MNRRARLFASVVGVFAALAVAAPSAGAFPTAATSGNASCIGAGSSSIAPGQGFGFPGERAEVAHFGIGTAADLGLPPGQIAAFYAHQHDTAAECFPEGVPGQP